MQDSGIGIRAKDFNRLFIEFQQLDASSAKKYQGTGLGLALTRRIVEAQGGAEALAATLKTPPDLIIQDLLLPDMDGFELLWRLRAEPDMVDVPIIAFSGFLSRLEYGRATAMGFTDFMAKPVEPSRLVSGRPGPSAARAPNAREDRRRPAGPRHR